MHAMQHCAARLHDYPPILAADSTRSSTCGSPGSIMRACERGERGGHALAAVHGGRGAFNTSPPPSPSTPTHLHCLLSSLLDFVVCLANELHLHKVAEQMACKGEQ